MQPEVNGVPAVEGLKALAAAVMEFDRTSSAVVQREGIIKIIRKGHGARRILKGQLPEMKTAAENAYRNMVNKAKIVFDTKCQKI